MSGPTTDYVPERVPQRRVLEPLGDRIIVKVVKDPEMTAGGVLLPDSVRERSQRGIVVAVGPGRFEQGERQPLNLEPGDIVLFSKYGGTELPEGLEERDPLLVLREADVLTKETWVDDAPEDEVLAGLGFDYGVELTAEPSEGLLERVLDDAREKGLWDAPAKLGLVCGVNLESTFTGLLEQTALGDCFDLEVDPGCAANGWFVDAGDARPDPQPERPDPGRAESYGG